LIELVKEFLEKEKMFCKEQTKQYLIEDDSLIVALVRCGYIVQGVISNTTMFTGAPAHKTDYYKTDLVLESPGPSNLMTMVSPLPTYATLRDGTQVEYDGIRLEWRNNV
jgi:hypothetical protein